MRPLLARSVLAAALAASAACATAPKPPGAGTRPAAPPAAGAALSRAGYEAGVLAPEPEGRPVAGPIVVTWLAEGTLAALARPGEPQPLGVVVGPLATPLHVPTGLELRGTGTPGAWTGYRPQAAGLVRPLEPWVGKQVRVALGGQPAEPWWLRELGADHLLLERSRTYRAVPLRRIAEITWTELSGIDPTPLLVVAPE